jgi:hypothetical protein
LKLSGKAAGASAHGQNRPGETVHAVTVAIDKADTRLRWNMAAMVEILWGLE